AQHPARHLAARDTRHFPNPTPCPRSCPPSLPDALPSFEEVVTAEEDLMFSLPKELRKDLKAAGQKTSNRADGLEVFAQLLRQGRAEEHTSELQSRFALVCRLLLTKNTKPPEAQVQNPRS